MTEKIVFDCNAPINRSAHARTRKARKKINFCFFSLFRVRAWAKNLSLTFYWGITFDFFVLTAVLVKVRRERCFASLKDARNGQKIRLQAEKMEKIGERCSLMNKRLGCKRKRSNQSAKDLIADAKDRVADAKDAINR